MTEIRTHRSKSVNSRKRRLGIIGIIFTALMGGAIAFAAWTSQGTGNSGTVTAGTQAALVATGTTPAIGLTPGSSRLSTYTIMNPNTYTVTVTSVTVNSIGVTDGLGVGAAACTSVNSGVTAGVGTGAVFTPNITAS